MLIVGIDTGTTRTAAVLIDTETKLPVDCIFADNRAVQRWLAACKAEEVCIEILTSYGMAGETVFTAQLWAGIYWGYCEALDFSCSGIYRKVAVKHLAGNANAGDKGVRAALITKYGYFEGNKGLGSKKDPGPIHMLSNCHLQAAMCIALGHVNGAAHVDLNYSQSDVKKAKDKKKKEARIRKGERSAKKGSSDLAGKGDALTALLAKGNSKKKKK